MTHLNTAVRQGGRTYAGTVEDSHDTIKERHNLKHGGPDSENGFVPSNAPRMWLSRLQALSWLRKFEPGVYAKLRGKLPPDGLHSHIYAAAKGVVQKLTKEAKEIDDPTPPEPQTTRAIDLSEKTAIVYDRGGLYLYCAEKLAEKYKTVYYYLAEADAYPTSQKARIGEGLPGVKRVHDFWGCIDEADIIYFFDCYDGEMQHWLRSKGLRVFGSGRGEQIEIDKIKFLDTLKEVGLPVAPTKLCKGMDELEKHLESCKDTVWLKNMHRGDFETKKFRNPDQIRPFLHDLRKRLGTAANDVEILVQSKIDSVAEVGYDGFCVNGEFTKNCIVGYELKDEGFVGKVFDETPPFLGEINEAFGPVFSKLGYNGNYSTEIRVTDGGERYYIDATCRVPSPPGEVMCEVYENWAEATWQIAGGEVPELKPTAPFVACVILVSPWHEAHELCVQFPPAIAANIKLKNHTKEGESYYCIPNNNGGFFGAAVAWGKTLDEAIEKVLECAKQVEADEFKFDDAMFDDALKQVETGAKYGLGY